MLHYPDADYSISSSWDPSLDPSHHDHDLDSITNTTDTNTTNTNTAVSNEEFLVQLYDRTNQATSRILEIQDEKFLLTVDFSTGKTVDMLDLSCLIEIEQVDTHVGTPESSSNFRLVTTLSLPLC